MTWTYANASNKRKRTRKASAKKYYSKNKEGRIAKSLEWYYLNRVKTLERRRQYRKENAIALKYIGKEKISMAEARRKLGLGNVSV